MSGSGIIIEKQFVTIEAYGRVVRYRVVDRKAEIFSMISVVWFERFCMLTFSMV